MSVHGRRVLLTGGTRGIGRAVALGLARAGATVVTCARHDGEDAEGLRREFKEIGGDHHVVQADVSDAGDVDRLVGVCLSAVGGLDVVVNNAGAISHAPFAELAVEDWHRVLDASLTGAFLVTQRALPLLGHGASIVNIGAAAALRGLPGRAHYTAAKAGLIGLTRSLAKELGPAGIRVNLVAPGPIETGEADERALSRYRHLIALGRPGTPDDVAGAVLFLAGDQSRFVTGETLMVDGGI
ncbi:SDR family NAD(P)-dependent oxidoreductase [Microtetraspora glauca]|uniref:SDR family NAD(P)-dependent oxidoreductase n=1 Tax=Microtetraspora glauca TaxID=1996 RepID=A0ABV3G8E6_MICGL